MGLWKKLLSILKPHDEKRRISRDAKEWHLIANMIHDLDRYDDERVYHAYVRFKTSKDVPSTWHHDLYDEIKRYRPTLAGHMVRLGEAP